MEGNIITIEDIRKVSLDILDYIADICNKEGLTYFITYGTLLGAVRHKGFIPWDDDVDIMMPRPDYDKFCELMASKYGQSKTYKLFNMDTVKEYPYMISRLCNTEYYIEIHNEKSVGMGLFVDIYPLDGLGRDYDEACHFMSKIRKYPRLIFLSTRCRFEKGDKKGKDVIVKWCAYIVAKLIGKQRLVTILESCRKKYDFEKSTYVGVSIWGRSNRYFIFEKEKIYNLSPVKFEDRFYNAPSDYDYFLKKWYNDYMLLPPKNERVFRHNYSAYQK